MPQIHAWKFFIYGISNHTLAALQEGNGGERKAEDAMPSHFTSLALPALILKANSVKQQDCKEGHGSQGAQGVLRRMV
jgi:hypothetical protein